MLGGGLGVFPDRAEGANRKTEVRGRKSDVRSPASGLRLMSAVQEFNERFGFHFTEPVDEHALKVMAGFARESGALDLAEKLESLQAASRRCESVAEHNAFPGGRW